MTDWAALEALPRKPRVRVGKAVAGGPSERDVQRQIVKALRRMGYLVHHSPNGGHLAGSAEARMRQSAALKADGMMVGFPDLICVGLGKVCCFEVKRAGGEVSPEQIRLADNLQARGMRCGFVSSLDDVLRLLREWGW